MKNKNDNNMMGAGIAIGTGIGVALGSAMDHMGAASEWVLQLEQQLE